VHALASLLVALGEDPAYVMAQTGHTNPGFTLRVFSPGMRRDDDARARLKMYVKSIGWAPLGASDASAPQPPTARDRSEGESPAGSGAFGGADEGTRTLDLLHGKQTL
jgi:hypothetical protein